LKSKTVDAVMVVKEGRAAFYEYSLLRAGEDCTAASKTRYYPVTMAGLMEQLRSGKERFAVVGIACFIKAIRLLQYIIRN
jgi:coenzyme F420-reducing hydrogenase beta subunit